VTADEAAVVSAGIELKYDGYLAREREAAARLAELASFALPTDLPYVEFKSLATEARQKPRSDSADFPRAGRAAFPACRRAICTTWWSKPPAGAGGRLDPQPPRSGVSRETCSLRRGY